jgi:ABC-2 type transport system ATP-binding protein
LEDAGVTVDDFHTREASLEDLFLAYTEGDAPNSGAEAESAEADAPADAEEVRR